MVLTQVFVKKWDKLQSKYGLNEVDVSIKENVMYINLSEVWLNISQKTLIALKTTRENYEFDFLIRANSTCYVNVQALENLLTNFNDEIFYGGPILKNKDFVSGWGIVLSSRAIDALVRNLRAEHLSCFDDEAVGKILHDQGIFPTPLPYKEITSLKDIDELTQQEIRTIPFYRMKIKLGRTRIDHLLMNQLHKRVLSYQDSL